LKGQWSKLVYTAGNWFIFDVTFYANGLFSATVLSILHLQLDPDASSYENVQRTAQSSALVAAIAIPGYYFAIFLIDRLGRRLLQQIGFACIALLYLVLGFCFETAARNSALFITLYGLSFFFSNCGPNTTTFVIPSEVYECKVRSTCSGISASAGKLGAVVGTFTMPFLLHSKGTGFVFVMCGFVALGGLILSLLPLVPETSHKSCMGSLNSPLQLPLHDK